MHTQVWINRSVGHLCDCTSSFIHNSEVIEFASGDDVLNNKPICVIVYSMVHIVSAIAVMAQIVYHMGKRYKKRLIFIFIVFYDKYKTNMHTSEYYVICCGSKRRMLTSETKYVDHLYKINATH